MEEETYDSLEHLDIEEFMHESKLSHLIQGLKVMFEMSDTCCVQFNYE